MALDATTFDDIDAALMACADQGEREQLCDLLCAYIDRCANVRAKALDGLDNAQEMADCAAIEAKILEVIA